jgi:molybdopterin converting factor small subunit
MTTSPASVAAASPAAPSLGPTAATGGGVTVRIPSILRALTGGASVVTVDEPGDTLADLLHALDGQFPGLRARVVDDTGRLRRFVNVYVDEDDVRFLDGLDTPLVAGARVSVVPAVAGG